MKKYTIPFILLILISLISETGCWDSREVNKLALVVAVGLDRVDKGVLVSAQIVIPKNVTGATSQGGGTSGQPTTLVKTAKGSTISSAISNLQEQLSRELFWGQNEIVVIGEGLAKKGLRNYLDFFARHPEIRLRTQVFVSHGKARDLLNVSPMIEQSSSEFLTKLGRLKVGPSVTVKSFLQMISGESHAAILPEMSISTDTAAGTQTKSIEQTGGAIFKNDKMIGSIDNKTTRGVLWIRNEITEAIMTITPPHAKGKISLELIHSKTVYLPSIKDGTWEMRLKISSIDDIIEDNTRLDVMNPAIANRLEKIAIKRLNDRIKTALVLAQKDYQADIFQFSRWFHIKYPRQWAKNKNQWDDIFPNVKVSFDTNIHIERPGGATYPPGIPENRVIR